MTYRLTQLPVEVLIQAAPSKARVTQAPVEVLVQAAPSNARVSQVPVEVLLPYELPGGDALVTQVAQEVVLRANVPALVTQVSTEVVIGTFVPGRVTSLAIEVLYPNYPIDAFIPQIYRKKRR